MLSSSPRSAATADRNRPAGPWASLPNLVWAPLAALLLFIVVRLPLLSGGGALRGWNSDSAIFGLIGKKLLEGKGFDLYFWGQNYMGTMTAVAAAVWGGVLRAATDGNVWPLALRLATITLFLAGLLLIWTGIARFSRAAANLTLLAAVAGPPFYFYFSVVPYGAEMTLALGGALFAITAAHLSRPRGEGLLDTHRWTFLFGVTAGVGWWMNQTIVFYLAGISYVLLVRAEWFPRLRESIRLKDRLLLRTSALGWRPLGHPLRLAVLSLETLFLLQVVAFFANDVISRKVPMFFLAHPLREPLAGLVVLHLLLAWRGGELWARRPVALLRHRRSTLSLLASAFLGFLAGFSPTIVGKLAGWVPRSFGVGLLFLYPAESLKTLKLVATEVGPAWSGVDESRWGIPWAAAVALLLLALAWRHRAEIADFVLLRPRHYGAAGLCAAIVVATLAIYVLTQRTPDTIRYLAGTAPVLLGLLSFGVLETWRAATAWRTAARAAAVAICAAALVSFGAGAVMVTQQIRAEPDPTEVIERIAAEGCAVTYAGYWDSYRLRFLSEESLRFVTIEWFDRTPEDTRVYESLPGRRCHLHYDGSITDYTGPPRSKPRSPARR
jgi:hypothetical protein